MEVHLKAWVGRLPGKSVFRVFGIALILRNKAARGTVATLLPVVPATAASADVYVAHWGLHGPAAFDPAITSGCALVPRPPEGPKNGARPT